MRLLFGDLRQEDAGKGEVKKEDIVESDVTQKETAENRFDVGTSETVENNSGNADAEKQIVDDNGNDVSNGESLPPNKAFVLNGVEYKTDDNGRIYLVDGKQVRVTTHGIDNLESHSDQNEQAKDNRSESRNEKDNTDKPRMEPPVTVSFTRKEKYDKDEYERQVKNQEHGMNNISLHDYLKNREKYKESGRNSEVGQPAQEKARQEARADKIEEYRHDGLSRLEAEQKADEWLKDQAALHDPDQIAGGNPENVTGMGDKEINSSIGSQWQYRIGAVDEAVQKYIEENNLSTEDLKGVYLNIDLEVVSE